MFLNRYFLILFFIVSFVSGKDTINKEDFIKIGYMSNNIYTTKKESKIGIRLWKNEMQKRGFNVDLVEIDIDEKALEFYKKKKIYSLVSDGIIYYKYKKEIEELTANKWLVNKSNEKFHSFYLIKNRKSNFDFNNLSKEKIFYKDQMAKIWFEYLLLKRGIKSNKILSQMQKVKKDKNLIFNSFFNENSISILSKNLYDSMLELNPQIKEKIEIIDKSRAIFFNIMGLSRNNLDKEIQSNVDLMSREVRDEDYHFETFSFVKAQKIFNLKKGDLDNTDKFFEEYYALKNKNDN